MSRGNTLLKELAVRLIGARSRPNAQTQELVRRHESRKAGLIPRSRANLVLCHGVLAPHAGWRARVVGYCAGANAGGVGERHRERERRSDGRTELASRALFDLSESDPVYRERGVVDEPPPRVRKRKRHSCARGAFPLIARLPRLNGAEESERPVEVVLLSRNDPDTDSACSSGSERCPKPHEEARAVPALTRGENRPVV